MAQNYQHSATFRLNIQRCLGLWCYVSPETTPIHRQRAIKSIYSVGAERISHYNSQNYPDTHLWITVAWERLYVFRGKYLNAVSSLPGDIIQTEAVELQYLARSSHVSLGAKISYALRPLMFALVWLSGARHVSMQNVWEPLLLTTRRELAALFIYHTYFRHSLWYQTPTLNGESYLIEICKKRWNSESNHAENYLFINLRMSSRLFRSQWRTHTALRLIYHT